MSEAGRQWAQLVRAAAAELSSRADELTALDTNVGDGDHGVNLRTGMHAVMRVLDADEAMTPPEVFEAVGSALQESMAGTAGLLLGRFFTVGAEAIDDRFDGPTIALAIATGTAEIAKRGGARVGDRSMIDALGPAVSAAAAMSETGAAPSMVLTAAAAAAAEGAAGTARLAPRVGRAARATQLPTGRPDAGAMSIAIMLDAWAQATQRSELDV